MFYKTPSLSHALKRYLIIYAKPAVLHLEVTGFKMTPTNQCPIYVPLLSVKVLLSSFSTMSTEEVLI
jgi:hypothetical protein